MEATKLKSASEILNEKPFWPDLEKVKFESLLGSELVLMDVKVITDFHTEYGTHDLALLKFGNNGQQFTSAVSAGAVVSRVKKLKAKKALPCLVTPVQEISDSTGNSYYNIK